MSSFSTVALAQRSSVLVSRVTAPSASSGGIWPSMRTRLSFVRCTADTRRLAADVLTAATWRADSLPKAEQTGLVEGPAGRWREVLAELVELVRRGCRPGRERRLRRCVLTVARDDGIAEVQEMADAVAAAAPDLILVETMERIPLDLQFSGYETLLETGLPLWVAYRWHSDGPSDTRRVGISPHGGSWQVPDQLRSAELRSASRKIGIDALLLNCLPRSEDIPGTIPYLRQFTNLPLGAYPNVPVSPRSGLGVRRAECRPPRI